jgi:hypothetical protein
MIACICIRNVQTLKSNKHHVFDCSGIKYRTIANLNCIALKRIAIVSPKLHRIVHIMYHAWLNMAYLAILNYFYKIREFITYLTFPPTVDLTVRPLSSAIKASPLSNSDGGGKVKKPSGSLVKLSFF